MLVIQYLGSSYDNLLKSYTIRQFSLIGSVCTKARESSKTLKGTRFTHIILQASVCTSHRKHTVSPCQHHINHINTLCGHMQSSCSVQVHDKIQQSLCFRQVRGDSPHTSATAFLSRIQTKHKYMHMHAHKHTHTHSTPTYKHMVVHFGVMQQHEQRRIV
jgi:hypothetical protein